MLIDLLKTKWDTFVKFRFYRQFILFSCYFLVSLLCFTLRPGPPDRALNSTVIANETDIITSDSGLFAIGSMIMINSVCQFNVPTYQAYDLPVFQIIVLYK